MTKYVALFAVLALAACGPAGSGGSLGNFTGTPGGGDPGTQQQQGGSGDAGSDAGTDAGTDAGVVDAGAVTYSLDCTGSLFEASISYHYDLRDNGDVHTSCGGNDSQTGSSDSQSYVWAGDASDVWKTNHDNGACQFHITATESADGGGAVDCEKVWQQDQVSCVYQEQGPLSGTSASASCVVGP